MNKHQQAAMNSNDNTNDTSISNERTASDIVNQNCLDLDGELKHRPYYVYLNVKFKVEFPTCTELLDKFILGVFLNL